ncbi:MAG: DciA family protein [Propionibacteriaceae bacterium]|jgi:predicted nucleic acid-binding Zn ribbon protein|nr:DciA family protein [Propionibacteriaceae bacterium]
MSETHDNHGLDLAHLVAAKARGARPTPKRVRNGSLQPLADVMPEVIKQQGWVKKVGLAQVLAEWPQLVGEKNALHSKPVGFKEGVLTVQADATVWATTLRELAPALVAKLNEKLGDGSVLRVQIFGPKAPSWKHGKRTVNGRGPRDTYG